ncbi:hypothetical protein CERZMDRAFT_98754 [Cercospora zeae-maydis SCOH1-5]|uniref:Uncharacterized protein n=1 Tax=Cercospora zeae-maydis SCOH1-5 TaxID=717836 RepID=A0A6A6FC77_9PEZI|nr:hypothetical protein CERZMDRAFT_98754 [Cercospora zeae-maydis SCOH1-5]
MIQATMWDAPLPRISRNEISHEISHLCILACRVLIQKKFKEVAMVASKRGRARAQALRWHNWIHFSSQANSDEGAKDLALDISDATAAVVREERAEVGGHFLEILVSDVGRMRNQSFTISNGMGRFCSAIAQTPHTDQGMDEVNLGSTP